jgi:hypothetical protein
VRAGAVDGLRILLGVVVVGVNRLVPPLAPVLLVDVRNAELRLPPFRLTTTGNIRCISFCRIMRAFNAFRAAGVRKKLVPKDAVEVPGGKPMLLVEPVGDGGFNAPAEPGVLRAALAGTSGVVEALPTGAAKLVPELAPKEAEVSALTLPLRLAPVVVAAVPGVIPRPVVPGVIPAPVATGNVLPNDPIEPENAKLLFTLASTGRIACRSVCNSASKGARSAGNKLVPNRFVAEKRLLRLVNPVRPEPGGEVGNPGTVGEAGRPGVVGEAGSPLGAVGVAGRVSAG